MTQLTDLEQALDRLLQLSATKKLLKLNSQALERAYEAYVLGLCMEAVRRQKGEASLVGIKSGTNPTQLVFRGGPGSMASTVQDFCYAECKLGKKYFEIHLDVEYIGQSGATHEIDVSIYDHEYAQQIRSAKRTPRTNKPLIMAFECKFYTSTPGVSLARTFVGLVSDCASTKLEGFVSNISTKGINMFLSKSSSPEPFTDLSPLDKNSEETFIGYVAQVLRKWAASK